MVKVELNLFWKIIRQYFLHKNEDDKDNEDNEDDKDVKEDKEADFFLQKFLKWLNTPACQIWLR